MSERDMSQVVCPYLGSIDNPEVFIPAPGAHNGCYSTSAVAAARIAPQFQAETCLTDQYGLCSRYQATQTRTGGTASRYRAFLGGGLLVLVLVCGCAAMAAAGFFVARQLRGSPTPIALASATAPASRTPTDPPTATASPTMTATPAPTFTFTPVIAPTSAATVAPTPTLFPTATPRPTARPYPTAPRYPTPRPQPTYTPRPTGSPTPTRTPTVTRTPSATAVPLTCKGDEIMTFTPAAPVVNGTVDVTITVRSARGHANVSIIGPDSPAWQGVDYTGGYYYWKWLTTYTSAGSRTYSFKINKGAQTCVTATVTVVQATATPTPTPTITPTPVPLYGVSIDGPSLLTVPISGTVTFNLSMKNTGNMQDTFDVGLLAGSLPGGWSAVYCVENSGNCFGEADVTPVSLAPDAQQALFVKLTAPGDAQPGDQASAQLWATSQTDPDANATHTVTAVVVAP